MNTIVMNTLTGAVSEYTNFQFDSITPKRAGSAGGLHTLGGDLDISTPIVSQVITGRQEWGASLKKLLSVIYLSIRCTGPCAAIVQGKSGSWTYPAESYSTGVTRAKPGLGIRENYLAFGFQNTNGDTFVLDRIEVPTSQSNTRRV
ncbi:hypothetical protein PSQ40_04960 [Curvibacter sp. HBC61]|uniref:Uncharacterized protein n=1 Tax=Curvibacter cyanobacteriorum TaxID=3026422 RepID=A0ABT5MV40_9BURK|nr:hypothetical protein [Curvibacter sp. HBC61]MDD0837916.1 hypothetical protein [Curvibacter sp. HBC61]